VGETLLWMGSGILFVLLGVSGIRKYFGFRRRSKRVKAVVTDIRRSPSPNPNQSYLYYPVLRFTASDGKWIEASTQLGTNPPLVRSGQRVRAVYDASEPTQVDIVGTRWVTLLVAIALTILGFAFIGIGVTP
jgi:hypothetical protein